MLVSRADRVAVWLLTLPAWAGVAGCGGSGRDPGPPWALAALALLLAAAGGLAAGALHARLRHERALRQARAQARALTELHPGWLWRTDAGGRLVAWQGPGSTANLPLELFAQPAVQQRLRAEQPFAALRASGAGVVDGSLHWALRGVPRLDDLGRFDGFDGSAAPTDGPDASEAASHALPAALASLAVPALVADRCDGAWRVRHFNPAAQLRWPQIDAGHELASLMPGLPTTLPAAVEIDGWQLVPFATAAAEQPPLGCVLSQLAPATAPAAPPDESQSESFSFTVSHDLRAPIRIVEGFTRIVKEDYGRLLDKVGNDHLDRVLGAAARMNLMIDSMLTLAKLSSQPLARQPVNLSQLAGWVGDELRRNAPERDAEIEIEPGLTVQGDPTLLRLVLENLLGNAWKYTARAARAQIAFKRADSVAPGVRGAYVVRDNGAGFDMRSADRLFGLFQRLHSASEFPGHGVGLASVRRIVRRHGGEIWAEAEPGRGAAFFFTLG